MEMLASNELGLGCMPVCEPRFSAITFKVERQLCAV